MRDADRNAAAWQAAALAGRGKDPTLLGMGYRSRALIGRHPTGTLVVDDLHDEYNSRPGRELDRVRDVLRGTLLPAAMPGAWQVFVGTPWSRDDALALLKSTGRYISVRTPAERDDKPVWPAGFGRKALEKQRALSGTVEYARMYLLDLSAAEGQRLRPGWLKTWPRGSIQARWPATMGVDYASAPDPGKPGDYFALALGRVMPDGRVVVEDGVRARLTQAEAEQVVLDWAARTPTLRLILVEGDGGGTDFYQVLLKASGLPLKVMKTGGRNKAQRIETRLAPLFEQGRIWLADGETAFLNAFRQEWAQFPRGAHDDTLDAVFWMAAAAQPELLVGLTPERKTPREPSPFVVWARG